MSVYCVFEEYCCGGEAWHSLQRVFGTKDAAEMYTKELSRVVDSEYTSYYVSEWEVFV